MSTKIEVDPKATTPASPESHDCCGGASAAVDKSLEPTDQSASGRSTQSTPAKTGCCCGGAKSNRQGQKR